MVRFLKYVVIFILLSKIVVLGYNKVLKPEPDRTVRPKKPRTIHLCGSFNCKNRSTG